MVIVAAAIWASKSFDWHLPNPSNCFDSLNNLCVALHKLFRILKTDLEIRPVFHKTDENTMAHLFLAVLAYQLVSTIRFCLKAKGIHHNWSHIVRIMNTQKAATVTMQDKNDRKIYIRKCSKPETKAREIYDALGYKHQPWIRKSLPVRQTGVLPEKQSQKTVGADNNEVTSYILQVGLSNCFMNIFKHCATNNN